MNGMNRIIAFTVVFSSLAVPAMAQDAIAPVDGSAGAPIQMQDVDTNRDGVVSPEESRAYINSLESNHALELQQQQEAARAAEAARLAAEKAKTFDPADANKDGAVSKEEQAAYQQKLSLTKPAAPAPAKTEDVKPEAPKEMVKTELDAPANEQKKLNKRLEDMKALDANNDGILQAGEMQTGAAAKFDAADANKDGVLSAAENQAAIEKFKLQQEQAYGQAAGKQEASRIKNRMKNADKDKDGQVSKDEYQTFMSDRQSNFDRNNDGVISEDEYRTDGEKIPSSYYKKLRQE